MRPQGTEARLPGSSGPGRGSAGGAGCAIGAIGAGESEDLSPDPGWHGDVRSSAHPAGAGASVSNPGDPLLLGPFELLGPLGQGGMGEVWRGRHARHGLPVAVKFIDELHAGDPGVVAAFRREVHSVASLNHAGIVHVFDAGEVPTSVGDGTGGRIAAGAPYLVMELASQGSLLDRMAASTPDWAALRSLLLELLAALGHAHARGVLHRDIKPANVLLCGPQDERPGWKLSDFGLAHVLGPDGPVRGTAPSTSGTPRYMAPEQIGGEWRRFGPWTDLYALGCVAHQLASGKCPFPDEDVYAVIFGHIGRPAPRVRARFPVPEGFDEWLLKLLRKTPQDRFRGCGEASAALCSLGEPAESAQVVPPAAPLGDDGTLVLTSGKRAGLAPRSGPPLSETSIVWELAGPDSAQSEAGSPTERPWPAPELPLDWSAFSEPAPSARLLGAGLGLYGLHPIPIAGRSAERDRLWDAALEVATRRETRAVVLRGSTGLGKSRLARWLAETLHESGWGRTLTVHHAATPGPADGLLAALSMALRTVGLDGTELRSQLREFLKAHPSTSPDLLDDLCALLGPQLGSGAEQSIGLRNREAALRRDSTLAALLRAMGGERRLLVVLDDAQWGGDSLSFLEHALRSSSASGVPVLWVLTVQDEAAANRPLEAAFLARLEQHSAVQTLALRPLSPAERRGLVRDLLLLEGPAAGAVEHRCGGNPLFAVQLVGSWVSSGALDAGSAGFRLRPGASTELPSALAEVWPAHLRAIADAFAGSAGALAVGAALGREVDALEWETACARLEVPVDWAMIGTLFSRRLAEATDHGWAFAHEMLRESVLATLVADDALPGIHQACADALMELHGEDGAGVEAKLALHLLAAGHAEAAVGLLARATVIEESRGDLAAAAYLAVRWGEALASAGAPGADPRWASCRLATIRVELERGEVADARRGSAELVERCRRMGWPRELPEALLCLGYALELQGNLREAEEATTQATELFRGIGAARGVTAGLLRSAAVARLGGSLSRSAELFGQARDAAERCGDAGSRAEALYGVATVSQQAGRLEEARTRFEQALEASRDLDLRALEAGCRRGLGTVAGLAGDLRGAQEHLEAAGTIFEGQGNTFGLATCLSSLGQLALQRADRITAGRAYRRARTLHVEVGNVLGQGFALLGLGGLAMQEGRIDGAQRRFRGALRLFDEAAAPLGRGLSLLRLGDCELASGQLDEAEQLYDRSAAVFAEPHNDFGRGSVLLRLARLARLRGALDRAGETAREARAVYTSIGSRELVLATLESGLVLIASGEFAEALDVLEAADIELQTSGRERLRPIVGLASVVCMLELADPGRAAERIAALGGEEVGPWPFELDLPSLVDRVEAAGGGLEESLVRLVRRRCPTVRLPAEEDADDSASSGTWRGTGESG